MLLLGRGRRQGCVGECSQPPAVAFLFFQHDNYTEVECHFCMHIKTVDWSRVPNFALFYDYIVMIV